MRELAGRAAVVTGGGSGIGRGIALALAAEGVRVMVADIEEPAAARVAAEIVQRGGEAHAVRVDVTEQGSLDALREQTRELCGPVQLLSNNAGVILPLARMAEQTLADWEYVFSVNLFGIVKSVQTFLPELVEQGEAHVVNTASLAGLVAIPSLPIGIYTASKYACVGYTEMLRGELAGTGVSASVLCPGMVQTNLVATSARNRPERFGGPDAESGEMELRPQMMAAEEVGPIVVRGIREDRLHILTHPQGRGQVEARFRALLDDFDAAERAAG